MLKKTVSFENLDGKVVSKEVYFNISANELVEKEALSNQTYSEKLKNIANSTLLSEIYPMVIEFLEDGYGIRTEDGDFEKSPETWAKFKNSLAYHSLMDDLLMDPTQNGNKLAEFITGMFPKNLLNQAQEANPGFRPGADTTRPNPPVAGVEPVNQIQQVSEPRTPELPGQSFQQ